MTKRIVFYPDRDIYDWYTSSLEDKKASREINRILREHLIGVKQLADTELIVQAATPKLYDMWLTFISALETRINSMDSKIDQLIDQ